VFSFKQSLIQSHYLNQLLTWIVRVSMTKDSWEASLQALEGYSDMMTTVMFLQNSKQLVSASEYHSLTVRLSNKSTEQHTWRSLKCDNSSDVLTWQQAADINLWDNTVQLWDSVTKALSSTLKGHLSEMTDAVTTVIFFVTASSWHQPSEIKQFSCETQWQKHWAAHSKVTCMQ
jgi:WD40 repeat protein